MIKTFCEDSLINKLSLDETNIIHNNASNFNNELNFDLNSYSIDLYHEKSREEDFNADNQSFLNILENKETFLETLEKNNPFNLKFNNSNNSGSQDLIIYTYEDITKILAKNSLSNILNKFTKDEIIENYESDMKLLNQKRKRIKNKNKGNVNKIENEVVYKRGRKKMDDESDRKHCKYSPDNIMKKIKLKLFESIVSFINRIVNKNNEKSKREIFKKLDYKYIKKLKQDTDLKLLNSTLKDILLKDISPKYTSLNPNSNRVKLEEILQNEKNDEIIMFALNLSFREFIDLLCLKKEFKDIEGSKKIETNRIHRLITNLPRIDSLIDDISKINDKVYLSHFIFHLYNYEQWFLTKKGRKGRNSKKDVIRIKQIK